MSRRATRRKPPRRGRRPTRPRHRGLVLGLLSIAVLAGAVWLDQSPLVALERVEVLGADRATNETVIAASGLRLGASTLRPGLEGAADGVLELPAVGEASVVRVDPTTIRISVVEHAPLARTIDGQVLGPDGEPIGPSRPDDAALPLVEGPDAATAAGRAPATAALAALAPADVAQIATVTVADRELTLTLEDGTAVWLGAAVDLEEKAVAVSLMRAHLGRPVALLDVRVPSRPVVRLQNAG